MGLLGVLVASSLLLLVAVAAGRLVLVVALLLLLLLLLLVARLLGVQVLPLAAGDLGVQLRELLLDLLPHGFGQILLGRLLRRLLQAATAGFINKTELSAIRGRAFACWLHATYTGLLTLLFLSPLLFLLLRR